MELLQAKLAKALATGAQRAMAAGALPQVALPDITVERPVNPAHGDYASNVAMRLARAAQMAPLEIAKRIAAHLPPVDELQEAYAAPPGFINLVLRSNWLQAQVDAVRAEGQRFGKLTTTGRRVQVEFVSVNPTGPVHIGHGRGAVLGSTLANVLEAAGHEVQREYYVNDAGNQMENFYRSLYARAAQSLGLDVEFPKEGYQGGYVTILAKELLAEVPDRKRLENLIKDHPDEAAKELGAAGLRKMLAAIHADLDALGVRFDTWFSERTLFEQGQYEKAMRTVAERGYAAQREGATWFTSTSLGEDKDNVLVRSNGTPTYFASDIAYHYNKFSERKFEQVIDIWGADHQGHVPRLKAAMTALGIDPNRLTIILSQLVTLRRGGEIVRISKRTGEIITLREVVEEVGADACRFFLLSRSADSQMDFDLEVAKEQSQENPVYYVQYAHARISGILRLAAEKQIEWARGDVALLKDEAELALIRKMLQLPELVERMATNLEPHHLPHYAQELAMAFHWFYKQCRVVSDDQALTAARLKLVDAARTALARTLTLMGMSAPETM